MSNNSEDQFITADDDPKSAVMLAIIYPVYAAIGIPANLIVLFLTVTTENIRSIPLNVCICSLAFSDMMVLVSCLSSTVWAITNNLLLCKVGGVGIYVFVVMSMIMPTCIAIARHAAISNEYQLHSILKALKTRKGILVLNAMFWAYGLTFALPFIITDKFGLDVMGFCGIVTIDSVFLWAYYLVFILGVIFGAYAVTFTFYRKLAKWIQATSSMITITAQTRETLMVTRSLMRMMKWLLFFPVVVYYPAVCVQTLMRVFPNLLSVHIARFFVITLPMSHMVDPLVTIICVKRYRTALLALLCARGGGNNVTAIPPSLTARPGPTREIIL